MFVVFISKIFRQMAIAQEPTKWEKVRIDQQSSKFCCTSITFFSLRMITFYLINWLYVLLAYQGVSLSPVKRNEITFCIYTAFKNEATSWIKVLN
jgi:hypothetical protein